MAYRATYRARREGQYGVILSADLILAEVAILRGDAGSYEMTRENIVRNMKESGQRSVLRLWILVWDRARIFPFGCVI